MELLDLLVKNLGVNEGQAKGGAGLIFNLVKDKMGDNDFAKIIQLVPAVAGMMKAAPKEESSGGGLLGTIGQMASSFGGAGSQLGDLANLAGGFEKLGLDPAMISKFVPIIMSFLEKKGGGDISGFLGGILK